MLEQLKKYWAKVGEHPFLKHLFIIVCVLLVLGVATHLLLLLGTRHSAHRTVPDLTGIPLEEALGEARRQGLEIIVNDSLYVPAYDGGVVLDQLPEKGVGVKPGRKVYVTINSYRQKMVTVPYVAGRSLRQAKNMLEVAGLGIEQIVYRPDLATNYVLEEYADGKRVSEKSRVQLEAGSGVTLYVGESGSVSTLVPKTVGLHLQQAKSRLWELGLNIGKISFDEGINLLNQREARVYLQTPSAGSRARLGAKVDLKLTLDAAKVTAQSAAADKEMIKAAEELRRLDARPMSESQYIPDPDELEDDAAGEQDELYEHYSITADRGQSPLRLDKFLTIHMERCSRNRIQTAADAGNILVNGKPAKSSYKVKPGDRISLVMPYPKREIEIIPENIPLEIPYEDDDLLLVNKPAGMVVHPGHGNYSATLVNALTYYLQNLPLFQEGDMRAGLVHRIDKNTSGLLVIAKNERAHARLAKQFFDHTITRRYVALVWGNFEEDEGTITGNIGRSPKDRQKMWVFEDGSDGKHAVTHYRVLKRYGYVTLIECRLETGRTHQIRVHMQWKGHPLFGDERYGGDRILKGTTFNKYKQFIENCFAAMPRQALHAKSLGFQHPTTGEQVYFESELPEDFRTVLAKWDAYAAAGLAEE